MALDPELLDMLVCPACRVVIVEEAIPADLGAELAESYRDKFRDGEPVVSTGLRCDQCRRLFPIVSSSVDPALDIPDMRLEHAVTEGDTSARAESASEE